MAVFGLGGIGINVVQGARLAGAAKVIGIDITQRKNGLATALGMTDFIDALPLKANVVEAIRDLSGGGVDVAFECTGILSVMRQSFDCCFPAWGTAVLLGVEPSGTELSFPPVGVRYGRTIRGSYFGGVKGRSGLGQVYRSLHGGKDRPRPADHASSLDPGRQPRFRPHERGRIGPQRRAIRVKAAVP